MFRDGGVLTEENLTDRFREDLAKNRLLEDFLGVINSDANGAWYDNWTKEIFLVTCGVAGDEDSNQEEGKINCLSEGCCLEGEHLLRYTKVLTPMSISTNTFIRHCVLVSAHVVKYS